MRPLSELRPLLEAHWYDAAAAVAGAAIAAGDHRPEVAAFRNLAIAAKRVLDLDAEDFGVLSHEFPDRAWTQRLGEASFPPSARGQRRGALSSLVPLYSLMLEVLDLRAARHEPLQVVVTAHLIGEYLPLLAWESTLGHAGDPVLMPTSVGERWGSDDPACPHSSALRSTARRALNAATGDDAGYTAYLDRFHSRLGAALAVCAMNHETVKAGQRPDIGMTCPNPCSWAVAPPYRERRDLDARVRLALIYQDSALVALRHHAPVGHFFGVPSNREISHAWLRTWERLTQPWADGENPLVRGSAPGAPEPKEALPGMSALVSAVAGRTIGPGHLIRDLRDDLLAMLDGV